MDRWVLYKGVFGCWGWERLDETGEAVAECVQVFDELEDCLKDAELHGYRAANDACASVDHDITHQI
jgi:hypothetical protein